MVRAEQNGKSQGTNKGPRHDAADAKHADVNYLPGQAPVPDDRSSGEESQPDPVAAEIAVNPADLKPETDPVRSGGRRAGRTPGRTEEELAAAGASTAIKVHRPAGRGAGQGKLSRFRRSLRAVVRGRGAGSLALALDFRLASGQAQ